MKHSNHRFQDSAVLLFVLLCFGIVSSQEENNNVIYSIRDDLLYDTNGKLSSHYLVYPLEQEWNCPKITQKHFNEFETVAVSGKAQQDFVFSTSSSNTLATTTDKQPQDDDESPSSRCLAACLERGTDRKVAHAVMEYKKYDSWNTEITSKYPRFHDWFIENCAKAEVCITNYYDPQHPLLVYWLPPHNEPEKVFQTQVFYGNKYIECFYSFMGEEFQIMDHSGNVIDPALKVEYDMTKIYGTSPPSDTSTDRDLEKEIFKSYYREWDRHTVVNRTFSSLGFAKGRLPDDIYASMGSYYYNNRNSKALEEWVGEGVLINWWQANVYKIHIPKVIKDRWQESLKHMVEDWAGIPLEQTMMYGMRQYETHSRLLQHTDHLRTHALSLIVNIAQGHLQQPWPVEVLDHYDRIHEILLQPGDIVYYESAKNLHGRTRPLVGNNAYYVNLFTHYRPSEEGDTWYQNPTDSGRPEPVLEVQGSCRLEPMGIAETTRSSVGTVEGVVCDDERLGPYVSPTLFRAETPDDLITWWKVTSSVSTTFANDNMVVKEDTIREEL